MASYPFCIGDLELNGTLVWEYRRQQAAQRPSSCVRLQSLRSNTVPVRKLRHFNLGGNLGGVQRLRLAREVQSVILACESPRDGELHPLSSTGIVEQ